MLYITLGITWAFMHSLHLLDIIRFSQIFSIPEPLHDSVDPMPQKECHPNLLALLVEKPLMLPML